MKLILHSLQDMEYEEDSKGLFMEEMPEWFAGKWGVPLEAYLITGHTDFYEMCGWEFYGMIEEDDGNMIRMYTRKTEELASISR